MRKIIFTIGTRPEAIKICPLIMQMRALGENVMLVSTHQHDELLSGALGAFGIKCDLELPRAEYSSLDEMCDVIEAGLRGIFVREKPDAVAVHGDTTSALASAKAAKSLDIPIFHIEAGLRSGDLSSPYPEEYNRREIDALSDFFFAPTAAARDNLLGEGADEERIFVTGNTGIDALGYTVKEDFSHPILERAKGKTLVFLTCHRRESQGEKMEEIFAAIKKVMSAHEEALCIFPVHPSPAVKKAASVFEGCENMILCEPLDPITAHNLIARASLILTDSGGIQEEAAALHIPTLILREKTERGEGLSCGALRLVGTKGEDVAREFDLYLSSGEEREKMKRSPNPFGDGKASERIAKIISERFYPRRQVLGLKIADMSAKQLQKEAVRLAKSGKFARICTVNAEIAYKCTQSPDFEKNINSADTVVADGQGVVDGARLCKDEIENGKCAGVDLAAALLRENKGLSFFFLGAKEEVCALAAKRAKEEYGANVAGHHDGYFDKSGAGSADVIEEIKKSSANVVFVCLGAPLQEEWIYENRAILPAALYIGLGGTLDVISGTVRRAPKIFVAAHAEWLWRLICSPRRLGRMKVIPKYLKLCKNSAARK